MGSLHLTSDSEGPCHATYGLGTRSLVGLERNEMEFKIKNASRDKLRSYLRDLFDRYHCLEHEKGEYFRDLVKAKHNQGWTEKQALSMDKAAKAAIKKEQTAK